MTLVLEISWSAPATSVRVRDTAAHEVVTEARVAHPAADAAEQDPAGWWAATRTATADAVGTLASMAIDPAEISLVLVDDGAPAGGLVVLGTGGEVVRPALLGTHESSAADAEWLVQHAPGGADAWFDATGVHPSAGSTVALLSWLHRSDAEAWSRLARLTLPSGWIVERLTGEHRLSAHAAVGTAVLDRTTGREWRTDLLAVVDPDRDWRSVLPLVAVPADPVGVLTEDAAADLGLRPLVPVHTGSALAS